MRRGLPRQERFTRWLGVFGVGLAVISAAGWVVAPIHVDSGEVGAAVSTHYESHRAVLLALGVFAALGSALQLAFFAGLRTIVDRGPIEQTLARVGLLCMLVEVALVAVAFAIFATVAYSEPAAQDALLLTDLAWILIDQAAGPVTAVGLLSITVALARSRLVSRRLVAYTGFVGIAHLVVAAAVAREGIFSPAGEVAFVVPLIFFSWFAAVGYALMNSRG